MYFFFFLAKFTFSAKMRHVDQLFVFVLEYNL